MTTNGNGVKPLCGCKGGYTSMMGGIATAAFGGLGLTPYPEGPLGGDARGGKSRRTPMNKFPDGRRYKITGKDSAKRKLNKKLGGLIMGGDGTTVPEKVVAALLDIYKQAETMKQLLEAVDKALERSIADLKKSDKTEASARAMESYKSQVKNSLKYLENIIADVKNEKTIESAIQKLSLTSEQITELMRLGDIDPENVNNMSNVMYNAFSINEVVEHLNAGVTDGATLVKELLNSSDLNVAKAQEHLIAAIGSSTTLDLDKKNYLVDYINDFKNNQSALKDAFKGGADISKIDAAINLRNKVRKAIASAFVSDLGKQLNKVVTSLNFGDKFGTPGFPVTDEMLRFGKHLQNISDFSDQNNLFALIGLNLSPQALAVKAAYMRSLSNLRSTIEAILRDGKHNSISQQLGEIKVATDDLTNYVSSFSDKIKSTDGMLGFNKEQVSAAIGGATVEFVDIATEMGKVTVDTKMLMEITAFVDKFNYRMTLSNVESSMINNAAVLDKNSKNYEDMLAKMIARQINELEKERVADLATLGAGATLEAKKAINDKFTATKEFYELTEATELHLKNFNNNVINKNKEVADLIGMLNKVNFNSDWYTNANLEHFTPFNTLRIYGANIHGVIQLYIADNIDRNIAKLLDTSPILLSALMSFLTYNKFVLPPNNKTPKSLVNSFININDETILYDFNIATSCLHKLLLEYFNVYIKKEILTNTNTIYTYTQSLVNPKDEYQLNLLLSIAQVFMYYYWNKNAGLLMNSDTFYYEDAFADLVSNIIDSYNSRWNRATSSLGSTRTAIYVNSSRSSINPPESDRSRVYTPESDRSRVSNLRSDGSRVYTPESDRSRVYTPESDTQHNSESSNYDKDNEDGEYDNRDPYDYKNILGYSDTELLVNEEYRLDIPDTDILIDVNTIEDVLSNNKKYSSISSEINDLVDVYSVNTIKILSNYSEEDLVSKVLHNPKHDYDDSFEKVRKENPLDSNSKLFDEHPNSDEFVGIPLDGGMSGLKIQNAVIKHMQPIIQNVGHIAGFIGVVKGLKTYLDNNSKAVHIKASVSHIIAITYLKYVTAKDKAVSAPYESILTVENLDTLLENQTDEVRDVLMIGDAIAVYSILSNINVDTPYPSTIQLLEKILTKINNYERVTVLVVIENAFYKLHSAKDSLSSPLFDNINNIIDTTYTLYMKNLGDETAVTKGIVSSIKETPLLDAAKAYMQNIFTQGGARSVVPINTVLDISPTFNLQQVQKVYKSNALLQNVIEIITKITTNDPAFMKPMEIYKRLYNYMVHSSNDNENIIDLVDINKKINATHILKAFCAKLFVTLGIFDINNTNTESVNNFSTMRLMVGGNGEISQNNTIYSEIIELYIRLPLVIDLHKTLFEKSLNDPTKTTISAAAADDILTIIPDSAGVYSNIIKFVFSHDKIAREVSYNSSDINYLISCINAIYLAQKDKLGNSENISVAIIQDYINVINERYTIINKEQRDNLLKELRNDDYYRNTDYDDKIGAVRDNSSQNQLIDDQSKYIAPSSKYTSAQAATGVTDYEKLKKREFEFKKGVPTIFKQFKKIMQTLLVDKSSDALPATLRPLIVEAKRAVDAAKSEQEKYTVIAKYMQNREINSIGNHVYNLFTHELIDTNMSLIEKYKNMVSELYFIVAIASKYCNTAEAQNSAADTINVTKPIGCNDDIFAKYSPKIDSVLTNYDITYGASPSVYTTLLLEYLLGCTSFSDLIAINIHEQLPVLNFEKFNTEINNLINIAKGNLQILLKVVTEPKLLTDLKAKAKTLFNYDKQFETFAKPRISNSETLSSESINSFLKKAFNIIRTFGDSFHTTLMGFTNRNNNPSTNVNKVPRFDGILQMPSYNDLYYYDSTNIKRYDSSIFKQFNYLVTSLINVSYDNVLQKIPPSLFQTLNNNIFNNSGNGNQSKLDMMPDPLSFVKDSISNNSLTTNKFNIVEEIKKMGFGVSGEVSIKTLDSMQPQDLQDGDGNDISIADLLLVITSRINDVINNNNSYISDDERTCVTSIFSNINPILSRYVSIGKSPHDGSNRYVLYSNGATNPAEIFIDSENLDRFAETFAKLARSGMHSNLFKTVGNVRHIIPMDDTILFFTVSELIRCLINTKNDKMDAFKYRADSTASLDMNVQDNIYVNYPIIESMLSVLQRKIKGIKTLLECVPVNKCSFMSDLTDIDLHLHNRTSYSIIPMTTSGLDIKNIYNKYLNNVNTSISLLLSSINTTLSELNTKSEYFEISNGFNSIYQQTNSNNPLGLLSYSFLAFQSTSTPNRLRMFNPEKVSDNYRHKIKRGNRSLLGRGLVSTEDISKNQGLVNLLNTFNGVNFDKFDDELYSSTVRSTVKHVQLLNNYYNNTRPFLSIALDIIPNSTLVYTEKASNLSKSLYLVEDSDQTAQMLSLLGKTKSKQSSVILMSNIVDLNISPININMMHNEIPGIYLFNYNNMFDINVIQMLKIPKDSADQLLEGNTPITDLKSNTALADSLINPYKSYSNSNISKYLHAFTNVDSSIKEFGSAKFLTDVIIPQNFYGMTYKKNSTTNPHQHNNDYTFSYELMNLIHYTYLMKNVHLRNLFFLTNLQRVIIYRINKEALKHTTVFTKGLALIDSSNTEFYGRKAYSDQNDKDIYMNTIEDRSKTLTK